METVLNMFTINFSTVFISVLIIVVALKFIVSAFEWLFKKLGIEFKWLRKNRKDHELLKDTATDYQTFKQEMSKYSGYYNQMEKEMQQTNVNFNEISEQLNSFIGRVEKNINDMQQQVVKLAEQQTIDRDNSAQIRNKMSENIELLEKVNDTMQNQMGDLRFGMTELLGDKLDNKFKNYVALNGIPENELASYSAMYEAYARLGGNGQRKEKHDYVMQHMKVIPVTTNLVMEDKK